MILESAVMCLALNIFHESRGEPIIVQESVAQVTMMRADNNPNNVCKEVLRPMQFSWANSLPPAVRKEPTKVMQLRIRNPDGDEWKRSVLVAKRVLSGEAVNHVPKAAYFYNPKTDNPSWKSRMIFVARLGNFIFMKTKGIS